MRLMNQIINNENHILHQHAPKRLRACKHLVIDYARTEKRRQSFVPFTTFLLNKEKQRLMSSEHGMFM